MVAVGSGRESAAQVGGNVMFRPAGDDCVTENPSGIAQCLVDDGQRAPFLHSSGGKQSFGVMALIGRLPMWGKDFLPEYG